MERTKAFKIIDDYFDSWLKQDKELFLSVLHDNVLINECTGDVYANKDVAKQWFEGWNDEGNRVLKWNIFKRYYDSDEDVGIVEWEFKCLYKDKEYSFLGSSIIGFKDGLIINLNKYEMNIEKNNPYGV